MAWCALQSLTSLWLFFLCGTLWLKTETRPVLLHQPFELAAESLNAVGLAACRK